MRLRSRRIQQFVAALCVATMSVSMLPAAQTKVEAAGIETSLSSVSVLAANVYYKGTGENVFTPYLIKEVKVGDKVCKVGILGIENTDCSRFDVPENYPDMVFAHPDNKQLSVAWEVERYVPELKAAGCDTIIVSYHAGLGSNDGEDLEFEKNTENQVARMINETTGVDMVVAGHDHKTDYSNTYVKNKEGNNVLVVNGGGSTLTQTIFTVDYDAEKGFTVGVKDSKNLDLSQYEDDMDLASLIEPSVAEATEYVNQECGIIKDGDWSTATDFYLEQTDSMDLINRAQIAEANKYLKEIGCDDVKVSSTSVVVSNNYVIQPGKISLKDIYRLYKYDNYLYIVPLTGKELKTWLEGNAEDHFAYSFENGEVKFKTAGNSFTNPVFYGLDFQYDLAKEKGSRVANLTFADGSEVKDDAVYNVAINSYHIGQDPFTRTGKTSEDAIWSSKDALGDDKGTVQSMIAEYIKECTETEGGVSTAPSNWKLTYSGKIPGAEETEDSSLLRIPVYETSDVHGSIVDTSSGVDATYQYRLAYISDVIDKDREDGDVLLLDGGDIYQGTPMSNLAKGEPMIAAYDKMEYDAVALGNHEFDWEVTELIDSDGTMGSYNLSKDITGDSQIPVLCSNIYYEGTNNRTDFTKDYTIVEKTAKSQDGKEQNVKVAILGYVEDYSVDIMAEKIAPYTIKEDVSELETLASSLKAEDKADAVVLLTHAGASDVAEQLEESSEIDLVLGGHTHKDLAGTASNGITYAQPKNAAQSYVYAELCIDPKTEDVTVQNQEVASVTKDKTALYDTAANAEHLDEDIMSISKIALDKVKPVLTAELGYITTPVTKDLLENTLTSTAGTWMCDLMNRKTNSAVSFANNGGIRTSFTFAEGADRRSVTQGDIYTIAPFNNQLYVYEQTYADLLSVLNYMIESKDTMQLRMSGVTAYYTDSKVNTILLDGNVIYDNGTWVADETTSIRMSTNNYVGTSAGTPFVNWKPVDTAAVDNESFIEVLQKEAAENNGYLAVDSDANMINGTYASTVPTVQTQQASGNNISLTSFRTVSTKEAESVKTESASAEFVVLTTTDMHGKCWSKNILTDASVKNSFLRVSSAVKEMRKQYGDNVILIDNGDLFQGTQISSYNIAKGGTENPMAICLKYIGYDVMVLGNHEFNFSYSTMTNIYKFLQSGSETSPEQPEVTPTPSAPVVPPVVEVPTQKPTQTPVAKTELKKAEVAKVADVEYTGKAIKPAVKVSYNGKKLTEGKDYKVSYKNNTNAGTATITLTGMNTYTGTKTVNFKITKKETAKLSVSKIKDQTYTGKSLKPAVTVKNGSITLKQNKDYTVSYKNNKNTGKATITITGKGNYTGTKKVTFRIVPKKVTISKVKSSAKKTAAVTWKKTDGASGYQVSYATKKNGSFKSAGTTTKTSMTVKGLSRHKTYYVKVRAYKVIDGKKVYGSYSSVKSVKVK